MTPYPTNQSEAQRGDVGHVGNYPLFMNVSDLGKSHAEEALLQ